jgi:predicted kinase
MTEHLIVMAGLPGTGKSTSSKRLVEKLGYHLISQNDVRREHGMKDMPLHQEGVLRDVDRRVFKALAEGKGVILDAAHRAGHRRHQLYGIASGFGVEVAVIECVTTETEAKRRMQSRPTGDGLVVDAWDPAAYDRVAASWQDISADFSDISNHVAHLTYNTEKGTVEINKEGRDKAFVERIKKALQ